MACRSRGLEFVVVRQSGKSQAQEAHISNARTKQSEQEGVNTKSPPPVTYFLQQGSPSEKFYNFPDSIAKFKYGVCWGHSCSNHQPRKALPQDQQEDQAVSAAGLRSATMWCWFCRMIQGLGVIEPDSYAYSNCRQPGNTEVREMGFPGMRPINGIQNQEVSSEIIYMQVTPNKTRYIYECVYTIYAYCMYFHKYIYM